MENSFNIVLNPEDALLPFCLYFPIIVLKEEFFIFKSEVKDSWWRRAPPFQMYELFKQGFNVN